MLTLSFALGLAACAWSAAGDQPADPESWRTVRDLQNKVNGDPGLPPEVGSEGSLLMGASELSGQLISGNDSRLNSADYAALYSLLQRYRDELVGMGLDYDKLIRRLDDLKKKSEDLKERLDKLHPKDGAKIHGRASTVYSDMHLIGNRYLGVGNRTGAAALNVAKPAKDGLRYQYGTGKAEIAFEVVKGPISGISEINLQYVWGGQGLQLGLRRLYLEVRTPVAFQFGEIDTNLTPLTLWRNEDPYPFEPEPFKSRRERTRRDLQLEPDRTRLTGVRISTEILLFDSVTLDLQSMSAALAHSYDPGVIPQSIYAQISTTATTTLNYGMPVNTTYLEAWKAGLYLPANLTVAWNGALFFDDTQSRPNSGYRPLLEMVNSARAGIENDVFFGNVEYALSTFTAPSRINVPQPSPLTGTAMLVQAGAKGGWGSVKGYFQNADAGFHSAGAQVRTQDANYEYIGPLHLEVNQVNVNGGLGLGAGIPMDAAPVWNYIGIIPPGAMQFRTTGATFNPAGMFSHLLPYNYLNEVAPYGAASPNRTGYGADGEFKLFNGKVVPKFTYASSSHVQAMPVSPTSLLWNVDNVAKTMSAKPLAAPFTYSRMGAGLDLNFRLGWDIKISGGYTLNESKNGELSWLAEAPGGALVPFGISSTLLQAGLQLQPSETVSLAVGMQHLDAKGFSDLVVPLDWKGVSYDQILYGVYWTINEVARVDITYETMVIQTPKTLNGDFEVDSGFLKFQIFY